MAPDPEHEIPEDDGPAPVDAEGLTPIGVGPIGEGPIGPRDERDEEAAEEVTPEGETILQRHKVDRLTGYNFSRERLRRMRLQWQAEEVVAERERKRKKREAQRDLGFRKVEFDKYKFEVNDGENAFHLLMRDLERAQAQRLQDQALLLAQEQGARMGAIAAFNQQRGEIEQMARAQQFARDTEEEEELMELVMML